MKKKILISFLVFSALILCSFSVMAADTEGAKGFFDIGTNANVTIKPYAGNTEVTNATEKDLDGDEDAEQLYENSNKLNVSYNGAAVDEHYGVMLVDGNTAPTKDTQIYFIDQVTAETTAVDFNVYPRLPKDITDMTLYISSSKEGFEVVQIPLNYAVIEAEAPSGFYNVGTHANVDIALYDDDKAVTATTKEIDGIEEDDFYANANGIVVSYDNAVLDGFYGTILVDGSGVPTKDTKVYYIDQITAKNSTLNFEVYPMLPSKSTEFSLYISSNAQGFDLIKIPLNYYVEVPPYVVGDIDNNGLWNSSDALSALQIGAGVYEATETERLAANVNGDDYINSTDALMILQYGAGLIDSWN